MRRVQRTKFLIWATVSLVYATGLEVQFAGGLGELQTVFHVASSPSPHYEEFAAGSLGVLHGEFRVSELVVAYRYLAGQDLAPAEREAVVDFWKNGPGARRSVREASRAWQQATGALGDDYVPPIRTHLYLQAIGQYVLNCHESAFDVAVSRHQFYRDTYGADSDSTWRWQVAQGQVFSNCGDKGLLPKPPNHTFDAVEHADREYQIAAAHFYRADYDEAHRRFLAIGRDAGSHWRRWGVYLAARAMLRKGTIEQDPDALRSAIQRFQSVIGSPAGAELHASAKGLIRLARLRLGPKTVAEVAGTAEALQREIPTAEVGFAFREYALLLDRVRSNPPDTLDPMSAWIVALQGTADSPNREVAQADMNPASLVLALHRARADDADTRDLIAAGLVIPPSAPAYDTARFHAARLLIESGERDRARLALTAALEDRTRWVGLSTGNQLSTLRLKTARTLDQFLADAAQVSIGISGARVAHRALANDGATAEFGTTPNAGTFIDESLDFLNRTAPLSVLIESAQHGSLSSWAQRTLMIAAWTRAVILGDEEPARTLSIQLEALAPEAAEALRSVRSASTTEWRTAAALVMLEQPGWSPYLRPAFHQSRPTDEFLGSRWNWWSGGQTYGQPFDYVPDLLSDDQRQQGRAEFAAIRSAGPAPMFIGNLAVAWANANPRATRAPRVLHRVVYMTRYCCSSDEKGNISKAAFDLLHRRYPSSEWAEKTPYWFR